jgi:hypothetical protein
VTVNYRTAPYNCAAPDTLYVFDITHNSATFDWAETGNDSIWQLVLWYQNEVYTSLLLTERPYTVEGLDPDTYYSASVRGYCGSANQIAGDWSGRNFFHTKGCPAVRGLDTAGVTATSVTLVWEANPMAQDYLLQYGPAGFMPTEGADSMVSGNSCVIVGLRPATAYDFYVRTRCDEDWLSSGYMRLRNVVTRQEVGIREVKPQFHFTLTPNPAKGVTSVQIVLQPSQLADVLHVTVADLTGRDVLARDLECDGNCRMSLDIEGLPAGAYFVRITGKQGSAVRKLIVK